MSIALILRGTLIEGLAFASSNKARIDLQKAIYAAEVLSSVLGNGDVAFRVLVPWRKL